MNLVIIAVILLALAGRDKGGGGSVFKKPSPPPSKPQSIPTVGSLGGRPAGNPYGGATCPHVWGFGFSVLDAFRQMGYITPTNRTTMNAPGPDGKLGGGDDVPNTEVLRFQRNFNSASKAGILGPKAGGLDEDGYVGWCTTSGVRLVFETVGPAQWATLYPVPG